MADTGPLVAFLNRRDEFHAWAVGQLAEAAPPLLTCEAVLAEVCYLLRRTPGGGSAALAMIDRGALRVGFRAAEHTAPLGRLMAKYARVPMSLADACLVRMSETIENATVMTLDRDFLVYRRNGRQSIPLLAPWLGAGAAGPG